MFSNEPLSRVAALQSAHRQAALCCTARRLHQLTATCGWPAAGSSVPTPPTRMGRGTLLTPCSPQGTPLPSGRAQRGKRALCVRREKRLRWIKLLLISGGMQPLRGLDNYCTDLLASATASAEPTVSVRSASAQRVLTQLGQQACGRPAALIVVPEMCLFRKTE